MIINHVSEKDIFSTFTRLDGFIHMERDPSFTKYIRIGDIIIRIISYSQEYLWHIENQFTLALCDKCEHYDCTLVIWKESKFSDLIKNIIKGDNTSAIYRQYRIHKLHQSSPLDHFLIYNENILHAKPLLEIHCASNLVMGWNPLTNTYYYADHDLSSEEFIKRGHAFVQIIARIVKRKNSNLAHGAVVGLNNTGVLLCGKGYRGKSTFSVQALLDEFEYVSDDYIMIEKDNTDVYASPIYSIITLHPHMWQKFSHILDVKFISNNARKDKYVFNISKYHRLFRRKYPIKIAMMLNICHCKEPSIEEGYKYQAMDEFICSSVAQTGDMQDVSTIAKLEAFIKDLPFYRINLSTNLEKNVECLKNFLQHK